MNIVKEKEVFDLTLKPLKSIRFVVTRETNLQDAMEATLKEKGNEKILFIMDASLTVSRTAPRIFHKRKFIHGPMVDKKVKNHIKPDDLFVD
ncbi:hypothetical protein KJ656_12970 [bacterium]|nr:hypothetical protein [bacterium]